MRTEIQLFDNYLAKRKIEFSAIIIGGAALNIMGIISRETRDIDFLDPEIPVMVKEASVDFALATPELKLNPQEWFNNGPIALQKNLPDGWKLDLQMIFK